AALAGYRLLLVTERARAVAGATPAHRQLPAPARLPTPGDIRQARPRGAAVPARPVAGTASHCDRPAPGWEWTIWAGAQRCPRHRGGEPARGTPRNSAGIHAGRCRSTDRAAGRKKQLPLVAGA